MATNPLGAESAHVITPNHVADMQAIERFLALDVDPLPLVAVSRALSKFAPNELGTAIEVLIALMDLRAGDADAEDGDEDEEHDGREHEDGA